MRDGLIGALFLLAMACYATGSDMAESAVVHGSVDRHAMAFGALLMLGNSVCVAVIGVLMYPILHEHDENVALGYVVVRCFEGILLIVGIVSLLSQQALTEVASDPTAALFAVLQKANFFAYQMAMCILGIGSMPVCYTLLRSGLLPVWLSLWGLVGYAVFAVGAIAEIFGFSIGVMLSAPAGLFEVTLPIWLFTKGFARDEGSQRWNAGEERGE
ncbi:unnamed protein product [Symbiodinium natans]|uniref:DUF4386 domain-containing protein n=1 Tax=Symbiodinium natans TaxID=878477 RepID=A0A812P8F6_9DINO|nr:unnamed protein product [Symbiodinium natans]